MAAILLSVLLSTVLAVAGVAGVLIYLVKSGKLANFNPSPASAPAPKPAAAVKTHDITLDPLLVNLADPDGHSYLRVGLMLRVEDPPKTDKAAKPEPEAKDAKGGEANAPLRDAVLDVLGREHAADLLVPEGKERLKDTLKAGLLERQPGTRVDEIYFTEFLVQR